MNTLLDRNARMKVKMPVTDEVLEQELAKELSRLIAEADEKMKLWEHAFAKRNHVLVVRHKEK